MIARPALDEIQANARIPSHVGAKQVGEEPRCERREYADAHDAGFAAPKRTGVNLGETYLCYCIARSNEELLTCMGEIDPSVMANKKCCSDFVFKVSYASADGRLLNCQRLRRASKATALSSGDNVSQMAQFDRQGTTLPRRRNAHLERGNRGSWRRREQPQHMKARLQGALRQRLDHRLQPSQSRRSRRDGGPCPRPCIWLVPGSTIGRSSLGRPRHSKRPNEEP